MANFHRKGEKNIDDSSYDMLLPEMSGTIQAPILEAPAGWVLIDNSAKPSPQNFSAFFTPIILKTQKVTATMLREVYVPED
jgi:hypothetical protein